MEALKILSRCAETVINGSPAHHWSQNEERIGINELNSLNKAVEIISNAESINIYNIANNHVLSKRNSKDNTNRSATTTTTGDVSSAHTESTPLSSAFSDLENEKFLELDIKDISHRNKGDTLPKENNNILNNLFLNPSERSYAVLFNSKKKKPEEFVCNSNPNLVKEKTSVDFKQQTPTNINEDILKTQRALNILYTAANLSNQEKTNNNFKSDALFLDSILSLYKSKNIKNNIQSIIDRDHIEQNGIMHIKKPIYKNVKDTPYHTNINTYNPTNRNSTNTVNSTNNNKTLSNKKKIIKGQMFLDVPPDSEMISLSENTPFYSSLFHQKTISCENKAVNTKRPAHNLNVTTTINKLKSDIDLNLFYSLVSVISKLSDNKKKEYIPRVLKQQNDRKLDADTEEKTKKKKDMLRACLKETLNDNTSEKAKMRSCSAPCRYKIEKKGCHNLISDKNFNSSTELTSTVDSIPNTDDLHSNVNICLQNLKSLDINNDINRAEYKNNIHNTTPKVLTIEDVLSVLGIQEFDDSIFDIPLNENNKKANGAAIHVKKKLPVEKPCSQNPSVSVDHQNTVHHFKRTDHLEVTSVMTHFENFGDRKHEIINCETVDSVNNIYADRSKQQNDESSIECNVLLKNTLSYIKQQLVDKCLEPPIPIINHKSIGSSKHPECHPCVFYWSRGCRNGEDCEFCHFQHPPKMRRRKRDNKNQ